MQMASGTSFTLPDVVHDPVHKVRQHPALRDNDWCRLLHSKAVRSVHNAAPGQTTALHTHGCERTTARRLDAQPARGPQEPAQLSRAALNDQPLPAAVCTPWLRDRCRGVCRQETTPECNRIDAARVSRSRTGTPACATPSHTLAQLRRHHNSSQPVAARATVAIHRSFLTKQGNAKGIVNP